MKTLVKPIRNEENPLVEGYCERGSCNVCDAVCPYADCYPHGNKCR